ncbi:MAG: hypothetical protein KY392_05460 [Chloroflexi bacterium]|nr:hypothetical protein [Chloroflexota bacterium]
MARSFPLRPPALPWRWLLRLIGVGPGRSQVELTADGRLRAAFGRLALETRLDNVCGYRITGPYRWWRSIGPRASVADHGFTFGTSTHGGVCLCFRDRVPTRYVRGGAMEALTVTVDDIDGFARALEEVGITGRDERAV